MITHNSKAFEIMFQFLYGAIGSSVFFKVADRKNSFNSYMVRLEGVVRLGGSSSDLFQFLYGAIGRK